MSGKYDIGDRNQHVGGIYLDAGLPLAEDEEFDITIVLRGGDFEARSSQPGLHLVDQDSLAERRNERGIVTVVAKSQDVDRGRVGGRELDIRIRTRFEIGPVGGRAPAFTRRRSGRA